VLERFPQLREVLDSLSGKIDAATMRRLNREVDEQKNPAEEVAKHFLRRLKLIPE
jgi:glycine betaine/choline ABC-type transport system substrate-binding protein